MEAAGVVSGMEELDSMTTEDEVVTGADVVVASVEAGVLLVVVDFVLVEAITVDEADEQSKPML